MKTANILIQSALTTNNLYQLERIKHLTTLATKLNRITTSELLNINLILINNEAIKDSYIKEIEEQEEHYLKQSGRIY